MARSYRVRGQVSKAGPYARRQRTSCATAGPPGPAVAVRPTCTRGATRPTTSEADMAGDREAQLDARVHAIAAPLAEEDGLELEEVEIRGHRGSRKVRLVVHAESGLDIDEIARLSRRVGGALDDEDVVAGSYTLEVTSPGADRPLRTARDFARNIGREVRVAIGGGGDDESTTETVGRVDAVDDEQIQLSVDGSEVTVPLRDVDHGTVVLPW